MFLKVVNHVLMMNMQKKSISRNVHQRSYHKSIQSKHPRALRITKSIKIFEQNRSGKRREKGEKAKTRARIPKNMILHCSRYEPYKV